MKFTVKSSELVRKLKSIIKGYDQKEDSSYISFEVDTEKRQLNMDARNRASYFSGHTELFDLDITADEPKVYYLDGVTLRQLTGILPTAPINVTFEITEASRTFKITYTGTSLKLPVVSDFARIPEMEITEHMTFMAADFMNAMRDLSKIVNADPMAQENPISCLHMQFKEDSLTMMGTDTFTLATIALPYASGNVEEPMDYLIRHTSVNTLLNSYGPNETLTVVTTNGMFGFIDEDETLSLVGYAEMPALAYQPLLDIISDENSFIVDKGELKNAIDTIDKLSFDSQVKFVASPGENTLKVQGSTGDTIQVALLENEIKDELNLNFVTSVISEALIPVSTDNVRIQWGVHQTGKVIIIGVVPLLADGSELETVKIGSAPLNVNA